MKLMRSVTCKLLALAALTTAALGAAAQSMSNYTALPPFATANAVNPMVLLTMSADHQFFFEAYNDFEDYNGDGMIDSSYVSSEESYVGYFDPHSCYSYNNTAALPRFVPAAAAGGDFYHDCSDSLWSGNFLNWVTMTRMDLVRHVLYGGFRRVDSPTETVLERAFLPHDGHSFAKYIPSNSIPHLIDVGLEIPACPGGEEDPACVGYTFCNTSKPGNPGTGVFTQAYNLLQHPPELRIVKGNYQFWASSERFQCLYGPYVNSPGVAGGEILNIGTTDTGTNSRGDSDASNAYGYSPDRSQGVDLQVRVQVCTGMDFQKVGSDVCRQYPQGSKPAGILQQFTEDKGVKFGLMTGGIVSNKSWGVLRRNVGLIDDEINADTGQFTHTAGVAAGADDELIISSLDALRIVDYQYYGHDTNNDLKGTYEGAGCKWGLTSEASKSRTCRNWGNPFSELLAESYRYFSGADAASVSEQPNFIPGLTVAEWRDPVVSDEKGACANMNVIGFNASTSSYDNDELSLGSSMNTLGFNSPSDGARTLEELMATVDSVEVDTNSRYFVGTVGANTAADYCTPKSIASLGTVSGICPEAPGLNGSFLGAGLAYFAYNYPVRPMGGINPVERPYIRTAGVTLAGSLPSITVNDSTTGRTVKILPACRNADIGGNCALVDFKQLSSGLDADGIWTETYFVGWEDSEQGGDFDVDMNGIIKIRQSGGVVWVETDTTYASTESKLGFGYIISGTGTDNDALYMQSGINDFTLTLENQRGCSSCRDSALAAEQKFELKAAGDGDPAAEFLRTPLFYAAKWGSFDKRGAEVPPPDESVNGEDPKLASYTSVTLPAELKKGLTKQIDDLFKRDVAGTGAAVSGGSLTGDGMIIQGLYLPAVNGVGSSRVEWAGVINGLFVDSQGRSREDTDENGVLSAADKVIEVSYDSETDNTTINRLALSEAGAWEIVDRNVAIDKLKPLWSAVEELAAIEDVTAQRDYGSSIRGRHILTGIAPILVKDEVVDARVVLKARPFTAAVAADLKPQLDIGDADAAALINYIRGQDMEGFRSRALDTDDTEGPDQKWLLGDLVNSTPAVVKRPVANFGTRFSDSTYSTYQQKYLNRRQVVYAGTNDGMLHAFNAGFYNFELDRYQTANPNIEDAVGGKPLGAELWAYVPYNLLPHLKWLADPEYSHVFYMDSDVQTFDVNIFAGKNDENTYPGGWGTILVAGMRFGGGPYTSVTGEIFSSAYVIMDITDPEQPPELLAEITEADLGFTVGNVELLKQRLPGTGGYGTTGGSFSNRWNLVFGSGPQGNDAYSTANSDKPPHIYALDLQELVGDIVELQKSPVSVGGQPVQAYVGGITSADWNRDFRDDALYFGLIGNDQPPSENEAPFRGALMQARHPPTSDPIADISQLLTGPEANAPFMAPPLAIPDLAGNRWLFAGSGRFMVKNDLLREEENHYFGLRVNDVPPGANAGNISVSSLTDVNEYSLDYNDADGLSIDGPGGTEDNPLTLADVDAAVAESNGWVRPLADTEAVFLPPVYINESIWIATYLPPADSCSAQGASNIYALDMFNGLPQTRLTIFGNNQVPTGRGTFLETGVVAQSLDEPIVGISLVGSGANERVMATTASGDLNSLDPSIGLPPFQRRSWREITLDLMK